MGNVKPWRMPEEVDQKIAQRDPSLGPRANRAFKGPIGIPWDNRRKNAKKTKIQKSLKNYF